MSTPPWWPEAVAAVGRRRIYAAELLGQASPIVEGNTLRLAFADPGHVALWEASGAAAALDGALAHLGQARVIEVVAAAA